MDIRSLPSSIEIYFWSFVISLLTDSEVIQRLVKRAYTYVTSGRFLLTIRIALAFALSGYLLGLILGLSGL